MDIERKTARKTGRSLFVFKFINEKDFSDTLRIMRDGVDDMFPDEDDEVFGPERRMTLDLVNKLESRTDRKYADDEYELSGMLFDDEIANLTFELFLLVLCYQVRFH